MSNHHTRETEFTLDVDTVWRDFLENRPSSRDSNGEPRERLRPLPKRLLSEDLDMYSAPVVIQLSKYDETQYSQLTLTQLWHKLKRLLLSSMSSVIEAGSYKYNLHPRDLTKVRMKILTSLTFSLAAHHTLFRFRPSLSESTWFC